MDAGRYKEVIHPPLEQGAIFLKRLEGILHEELSATAKMQVTAAWAATAGALRTVCDAEAMRWKIISAATESRDAAASSDAFAGISEAEKGSVVHDVGRQIEKDTGYKIVPDEGEEDGESGTPPPDGTGA